MQFANTFTVAGSLASKRTATKNGNVWGWFFGIASLGQTIEVRVNQDIYDKYDTGAEIASQGRIEQRGYNLNLIAEKVGKPADVKGAA